jgi:Glyoxalase/Bleomycin resistance protein/Dioxygenase superfamily
VVAEREQLDIDPAAQRAPHTALQEQGDDDGEAAEHDEVPGRVVAEAVGEEPIRERADDRSFDGAESADDGHEDDRCRPGHDTERLVGLYPQLPAAPRRLGHVLYTTTDFDGSMRFLIDVLGFKLSDSTPGVIAFLRCSTDHHNIGLINAPVPFFHHSSWQVNGVDEIGQGAQHLLEGDADRSVWGLGRHFLGSNYFWYFRDPAGNYAEYFADLDQIGEDVAWVPGEWEGPKSLYAWGPPVPPDFVHPRDVNEIVDAMKAAG